MSRSTGAAFAAAGMVAAVPAFVAPGGTVHSSREMLRGFAPVQPADAQIEATSSSTAFVGGMALVGAAALVARTTTSSRRPVQKVVRAASGGSFDPAGQIGAMAPLGFWDPAGFSKVGDSEGFRNLRAAEIKHARVAMMAALGFVVQHYVKIPGFESVPAGFAAVTTEPGTYGFAALFLLSGAMELGVWTEDPSKEPGDFGNPAGWGEYTKDMRNKELNNGRFAMFSAIGILLAEIVSGKDAIQQFGA